MDLQHIDVCTQSLHTGFYSIEDMLPAQPDLIDHLAVIGAHGADTRLAVVRCHAEVAFGEKDEFAAWDVIFFDGFGDDAFGFAVGVDVCCLYQAY